MNIDDFVAVSAMPGIYKMVANRGNGLIVEEIDSGKRKFAPSRKHQFTPLASIGIYADIEEDTIELKEVFRSMLEKLEDFPTPATTAKPDEITEYFGKVLPDYDRDRVYLNDIKKVIKWFKFLNERKLLSLDTSDETKEETETEEPESTEKESKKEDTKAKK